MVYVHIIQLYCSSEMCPRQHCFRRLHDDDNHYRPCEEPMENEPICIPEAAHGEEDIMVDGDIVCVSDDA